MKIIRSDSMTAMVFAFLFTGLIFAGCGTTTSTDNGGDATTALALASADITSGGTIGETFVYDVDCNGSNLSPALSWTGTLPSGTNSLAITVLDTSATNNQGGSFVHWIVYNIPITVTSISRGTTASAVGSGVFFANNDYMMSGYGGPCPPTGEAHTYSFKLWALSTADLTTDTSINFAIPNSIVTGLSSLSRGTASFTATYTGP